MNGQEAAAAWKLFRLNWLMLAAIAVCFALLLLLTDFRIAPQGYLVIGAVAAVYGALGYYNAVSPKRQNPGVVFALTAIAQMVLAIALMTSITYIATSANLPLQDRTLLEIDRAMGFDFRGYLQFINDRPRLVHLFETGYRAISWPILVIVVVLPLLGWYRRTGEFICAFMLALIATTCISTLVPATGIYETMGIVPNDFPSIIPQAYYEGMREIPALRDGALRVLDLFRLSGVLTFPSFHAASAILYLWIFWSARWLRPVNLFCNGVMIVATPVDGGHYGIDVIAGIVLAAVAIFTARRISAALSVSISTQPDGFAGRLASSGIGSPS